jgi:hypothetical protein
LININGEPTALAHLSDDNSREHKFARQFAVERESAKANRAGPRTGDFIVDLMIGVAQFGLGGCRTVGTRNAQSSSLPHTGNPHLFAYPQNAGAYADRHRVDLRVLS